MVDKKWLTPTEVANMLLVSPITVRQWAQKGLLEARVTAGGHRRFSIDVVRDFAKRTGLSGVNGESEVTKILVVDDDQPLNRLVAEWFKDGPYEVESAYDGFEAGTKVQTLKPDVVILDIRMPGLDGVEVCRTLKSDVDTLHIHVVAVTGFYTPENVQRVLAAGADRVLRKPFERSEMFEACGFAIEPPE